MSIKELHEIKRKDIPYKVRLKMAIAIRDFKDAIKSLKCKSVVEAFNNKNLFKDPDMIGVTLFYPTVESPTHIRTAMFGIGIGEKEFARQMKTIEKEFNKKIPKLR